MKRSKRYQKNLEKIQEVKSVEEAIEQLKSLESVKFDEKVEVHAKLNINPKKTEQNIRLSVALPHGTGKTPKIAVFCDGEDAKKAKAAGAELVYGEADIEKVAQGKIKLDFDVVLSTPKMMPKLAKIARILGPKGLMPNPKNETVTPNLDKAIEAIKKGKATLKNDDGACIHQIIGSISFDKKALLENYKVLIEALEKQKPAKLKGKLLKRVTLSTTMGPGVRVV